MISLLGGIFLGWSLGGNDVANVTAVFVGAGMLPFSRPVVKTVAGSFSTGMNTKI